MSDAPKKSSLSAILFAVVAMVLVTAGVSGCESPKGLTAGKVVETPQGCADQRARDPKAEC